MWHLLAILAVALPGGLSPDNTVEMENGVEYIGAEVPAEVASGSTASIELFFKADERLPGDVSNFLHVQSKTSDCRIVSDRKPTNYSDLDGGKLIAHTVDVQVPDSEECGPQQLDIYTGFYDRKTGARYEVESIRAPGNRIPAASIQVVAADAEPDGATQVFSPSDIEWRQTMKLLRPWWGWLGGLAGTLVLAFLLAWLVRRRDGAGEEAGKAGDDDERTTDDTDDILQAGVTDRVSPTKWWALAGLVLLAVPAILSILVNLDFVKDDAYISFRYAHNLVTGHGLVFNPGEYVEGFTNFLWVLVIAPFEAMGLDLFQVTEILGTGLVLGIIAQLTWLSGHLFDGFHRDLSHLWAGAYIATSSSLTLWATSGMEQPLAMLLPICAAYLLWTTWDDDEHPYHAAASGVLIGLGCMTRPEIHLIGILLGLPLVWRTVRDRKLDRTTLYWFAGLLGITIPFHAFRYWYFGGLLPNTYYVKTGGGEMVMIKGLEKLHDMFGFNAIGFLALLAPLAFLDKKHLREKLTMLGVAAGFMFYVVKVGVDEMMWHRLYLPALPFLVLLAAAGLRNLCATVAGLFRWTDWKRFAVYVVGWALVVTTCSFNFLYSYKEMNGFNGRGSLSGNYHPDIGKFLTRHARPGSLVAFQDMGSTPYHAPDLKFLDFIGLVDETVARARHSHGLHAFIPTGSREQKNKYDAQMREYFYERSPEWVILTSYIPSSQAGRVSSEFASNPEPEVLEPYIGSNSYQFQIYNEKFKKRYEHVRTWPRSATYYLSLFRRQDLVERIPGEVVFSQPGPQGQSALPEEFGGVEATFEGGLKLLGSKLEGQAIERQEFFLTTWWELPGPMHEDLYFFVHVEKEGYRHPYDHIPGDWLYPADRWKAGQILEDRVLVQIPPNMSPGTYTVYMGAYIRSTGERLAIRQGPDAGGNRLKLGTVEVRGFRPLLDHIIQPTRLAAQRKYPERIIDHRRTRSAR